ncbi:Cys-tRNA(Pro) deacylase, prolyl-tRNA editing enzyme YbaK/EbsC [Saccharopolyspora antimicrobica]|uniref:Cys-tRNA(Pro) deacylase, prolyl-tRNA editing enzyme YbaK/EbsC n=1 Tax=Saccharopolyspora antimicrobica TaxID=455193 RepID=A0A1I4QE94_9PSEU|nr:prolyl-tRNA editing enzyme YbaK/EbsC (Cys-tRNA(Pro) deacylase) [Saccharopolyspora antimicrobica]SFM38337.1 Cys-tRNA(Pro) deacylase, prolyl-tRNA editing enzyme YbaK/EbsC [Saccharopolyspora antimicrobica]
MTSALERLDLLADPVATSVRQLDDARIGATEIDPDLADTAAFCEKYGSPLELSANCVVVAGKRAGEVRYAACVVLATTRADVNGVVKRRLDVRKASFAPMDDAVELTSMEYGGITPFGLPADWPILIDPEVAKAPALVVGSGVRRSKLIAPGEALTNLPNAEVLEGLGR